MTRKAVLFVDDEDKVLKGLKRSLSDMRGEWKMFFAHSGQEALEIMASQAMDAVVSDMKMPGMDGAELLDRVKALQPRAARIVLSGYSDLDLVLKAVMPAHQYITKPCDTETLKEVVQRTLKIQEYAHSQVIRSLISSIDSLPTAPELFAQLTAELHSKDPSLARVAKIVSQDVAMSAKILKLVNSSFFGFCRHISSPNQAVTLLGINIIRALVLTIHVFSSFSMEKRLFAIKGLWDHCIRVSSLAKKIAEAEGADRQTCDDCFIAGLLHDVGKLILAVRFTGQYESVLARVRRENRPPWRVESEVFDATHAEVGAYLMGLWGLSGTVVEAIAFHHAPCVLAKGFSPLIGVYAANILDHRLCVINKHYARQDFEPGLLERLGLAKKLQEWEEIAEKICSLKDEPESAGAESNIPDN
ncbi:MAG: response regulator [Desulfovibrionaceae bacterium]|nr:response regulator [Desulfovibrionaceae bacterium]